jgi:hypothetical protein
MVAALPCNLENSMRLSRFLTAAAVATVLAGSGASAMAKGCLAGAAVGGVAGHVAGQHGLLGAAAGCAIGRHEANKHDRERAAQARAQAHQSREVHEARDAHGYPVNR